MANCSVNFQIQLEQLLKSEHWRYSNYNPDTFPGLIYHMEEEIRNKREGEDNLKVCLLIFASGKIVLTGAKSRKHLDIAYEKIKPVLSNFKKRSIKKSD